MTGGTVTAVTVPAGTSGGTVTVVQGSTTTSAFTGYVLGGVQIDVTAPAATPAAPLTLTLTETPPAARHWTPRPSTPPRSTGPRERARRR